MSPLTDSIIAIRKNSEIHLYPSKKKAEFSFFPITLTSKEMEIFNHLDHVLDIINKPMVSPMTKANISLNDACQVLKDIESVWKAAKSQYQASLKEVIDKDLETIKALPKLAQYTGCKYSIPGVVVVGAALVTGLGTVVVLTGSACAVSGYKLGNAIEKERNNTLLATTIVHRKAWLIQIDALEKERDRQSHLLTKARCQVLTRNLQKQMKNGEFSSSLLKELKQLQKFASANFPTLPLITNEGKVADFIKEVEAEL